MLTPTFACLAHAQLLHFSDLQLGSEIPQKVL